MLLLAGILSLGALFTLDAPSEASTKLRTIMQGGTR
jgi:hypothetical protein